MRNKVKEQEIKWPKGKWPEHLEINVQDYERNWLDSTENGHELRIVRTDGSTIRINMEWAPGKNPRIYSYSKPKNQLV